MSGRSDINRSCTLSALGPVGGATGTEGAFGLDTTGVGEDVTTTGAVAAAETAWA